MSFLIERGCVRVLYFTGLVSSSSVQFYSFLFAALTVRVVQNNSFGAPQLHNTYKFDESFPHFHCIPYHYSLFLIAGFLFVRCLLLP